MSRVFNLIRMVTSYFLKGDWDFYPLKILIEPTNSCNLRCIMCPREKMTRPVGNMKLSVFKKIVDESVDYVKEYLLSQNGEPLLHPQIFEMIKYAKKSGGFVSIFSNGTLLTEEVGKKLIESGLDRLLVTVDGATKETYERIRVNARFEKTISNITRFLMFKQKLKARNPQFILQITELKENQQEIPLFIKKFKDLPVDDIRVRAFDTWAGDPDVKEHAPSPLVKKFRVDCTQLWTTMPIHWDGRVVPCCRDYDGAVILGDVTKSRVMDVWNGPKAKAFRKTHRNFPLCNNCFEWDKELKYKDLIDLVFSYIKGGGLHVSR